MSLPRKPGGIYLLDPDGKLTEMEVTPFAAEVDFQALLAAHPNLLVGDQIDPGTPRRWLLISREVGVPDQEGTLRWSLDHLFLDQDGVPTLVEVKRSSDSRIRREVVGQMLDYAANSVLTWTVETVSRWFEERCQRERIDADEAIGSFLAGEAATVDDFWTSVKTNLQAGRIRLIFVADEIPAELRRVVEFLNRQMDPAEVLAIEIRQYSDGRMRTLVPQVFGQTSEAIVRKSTPGPRPKRQWDEESFFVDLVERRGEAEAGVARRILDWARAQGCRIWWGQGVKDGGFYPMVDHGGEPNWTVAVWTYGTVEIQFQWLQTRPPFSDEAKRLDLLERLNAIGDVKIDRNRIGKRPGIRLDLLTNAESLDRFLAALDWLVDEIRAS